MDDILIPFKSRSAIDKLKKELASKFEIKDMGEAKKVLNMEIERHRKSGKVLNAYTIVLSFQVKNYHVF